MVNFKKNANNGFVPGLYSDPARYKEYRGRGNGNNREDTPIPRKQPLWLKSNRLMFTRAHTLAALIFPK
jgi:hypothetical protein